MSNIYSAGTISKNSLLSLTRAKYQDFSSSLVYYVPVPVTDDLVSLRPKTVDPENLERSASIFTRDVARGAYLNNTPTAYDADANVLADALTAIGVPMTAPQKTAWTNYVIAKKAQGVWVKMKFVLPFIGGTQAAHSIEAKTGKSVMTWTGAFVHNANGVTGTLATSAQASIVGDSPISMDGNRWGIGVYVRAQPIVNSIIKPYGGVAIFHTNFQNGPLALTSEVSATGDVTTVFYTGDAYAKTLGGTGGGVGTDPGPYIGYVQGNRESFNLAKVYRNGILLGTGTIGNQHGLSSNNVVYILSHATQATTLKNDANISHFVIWEGMTAAEVLQDAIDMKALQTALGRAVV